MTTTPPRCSHRLALAGLIILTALVTACPIAAQGDLKKGSWTKADVPDGWVLHRTKNYQIQSECGIEKAERLGEHMEVMNEVYRKLFRPGKLGSKPSPIKLFKDRPTYLRYGAPPSAAAYFSRTDKEMVCYDTGKWSDAEAKPAPTTGDSADSPIEQLRRRSEYLDAVFKMDLLGVASHEGWHQYFAWYVGSWVQLPSWINEGMGDYFYTASPREVKGRKVPAELGRMFPMRLVIIKSAVESGRHVPVAEILHYMQSEYYSNPSVCYAEGWALCQFLLHSDNKKYNKVIPTYIRLVRDDTNMDEVTRKAFKGIDLEELERDFVAWVKQLELPDDGDAADEPDGGASPPADGAGNGG